MSYWLPATKRDLQEMEKRILAAIAAANAGEQALAALRDELQKSVAPLQQAIQQQQTKQKG